MCMVMRNDGAVRVDLVVAEEVGGGGADVGGCPLTRGGHDS